MIIILSISSFTFFFRAAIEILFLFDVIKLDFEFLCMLRMTYSVSSNGNMHLIGSHLYASSLWDTLLTHRTMYFFFFYFISEITPLSILLLSTYIRVNQPSKQVQQVPYSSSNYGPSTTRQRRTISDLFSRRGSQSDDTFTPVFLIICVDVSSYLLHYRPRPWTSNCQYTAITRKVCNIDCFLQTTEFNTSLRWRWQ